MLKLKLRRLGRAVSLYSTAMLMVIGVPMTAVYADDPQAQTTPAVSPSQESTSSTETSKPPSTTSEATPPKEEPKKTYTYDSDTQRWNTDEWQYDKTTDTYVAAPPKAPVTTTTPLTTSGSTPTVTAPIDTAHAQSSTSTTAAMANALNSLAQSGNADVLRNTSAGNAATGNATATATVINNVNSIVANSNNKEVASFVSDVMGDTNGDIILQPMLLKAMLEAGAAQSNTQATATNNTSLQNDLQLTATSGDATVAQNTKAGNATSGDANTVADVVNIVNSMVSANQSFVGTINIYGNLNGDILIAPDFIPQLIANNKELQSTASNATVSSQDTQQIINNVSLAAQSGQAIVEGNTSAGSATTGDANTNLVIFNLSGHEIVAQNSLLVFVNVLGSWVGVIVDAPAGATAGAIGSGVSSAESQAADPNLVLAVNNNTQIVNNIDLASQSGDATVAHNTAAGNATTGNATASANILNMSNSQLNLSGWFGILFINVFGSWNGSFGVDTAAGTRVIVPSSGTSGKPKVIRFVPREESVSAPVRTTFVAPDNTVAVETASAAVQRNRANDASVSDFISQESLASAPQVLGQAVSKVHPVNVSLLIGSLVLIAVSAFGVRRYLL